MWVVIVEAGKLALDLAKLNNPKVTQRPQAKIAMNQKFLGTGKKVITIQADQLINMTKERKVIIKQGKTLSLQPARIFQVRCYFILYCILLKFYLACKYIKIVKLCYILRLNVVGFFQGKIYQQDQEDVLIEKITSKLAEARRQADLFRTQLEKKEREAEGYKRQLDSITKARQNLKST